MTAAELREAVSGQPGKKKSKFRNKVVHTEDGKFDSIEEHKRFLHLRLLERAGEIRELKRQVRYRLEAGGIHISDYVADFVYLSHDGLLVVEDSKGFITPEYRQKRRLMKEILGITILETGRASSSSTRTKRRS